MRAQRTPCWGHDQAAFLESTPGRATRARQGGHPSGNLVVFQQKSESMQRKDSVPEKITVPALVKNCVRCNSGGLELKRNQSAANIITHLPVTDAAVTTKKTLAAINNGAVQTNNL